MAQQHQAPDDARLGFDDLVDQIAPSPIASDPSPIGNIGALARRRAELIRDYANTLLRIHPEYTSLEFTRQLQERLAYLRDQYIAEIIRLADDLDLALAVARGERHERHRADGADRHQPRDRQG